MRCANSLVLISSMSLPVPLPDEREADVAEVPDVDVVVAVVLSFGCC